MMRALQLEYKSGRHEMLVTLVVEELNNSFGNGWGVARAPEFGELCSRGRHYGVEVIGVSQRLAEVDTRFRGNLTECVVFMQAGRRDLDAAADALGFVKREDIQGLAPHCYIMNTEGAISTGKNRLSRQK